MNPEEMREPTEVKALTFSPSILKTSPTYKSLTELGNLIQSLCVFSSLGMGLGRGKEKMGWNFPLLFLLEISTRHFGESITSTRHDLYPSSQRTSSLLGKVMYSKHLMKIKY